MKANKTTFEIKERYLKGYQAGDYSIEELIDQVFNEAFNFGFMKGYSAGVANIEYLS